MRMSSRVVRLGGSPPRGCNAQASLARDCLDRGRRRAGAGSHRIIKHRPAAPRCAGGCGEPGATRDGPSSMGTAARKRGTEGK